MRLKEFQHYLKQEHIDISIFFHPDLHITYFTQQEFTFSILAVCPEHATLLISDLEDRFAVPGITITKLRKGWEKRLGKAKKVGICKDTIPVAYLDKLKKIFPKAHFVDVAPKLKQLRMHKTPEEIKLLQQACKITDTVFSEIVKKIKCFETEKDIQQYMEKRFIDFGAGSAFSPTVAMAKNSAIPHYNPTNYRLRKGFLLLDFGAKYQFYCADMTRTIYLGTPSKEEVERYNLLLQAQQNAIQRVKEGLDFWAIHRGAWKDLGKLSSHFIHLLGHGIGLEAHEKPGFYETKGDKVEQQQVFTIEPGVYFPGRYGIRIEDTVLFDGKVKRLTKSSKELIRVKY